MNYSFEGTSIEDLVKAQKAIAEEIENRKKIRAEEEARARKEKFKELKATQEARRQEIAEAKKVYDSLVNKYINDYANTGLLSFWEISEF